MTLRNQPSSYLLDSVVQHTLDDFALTFLDQGQTDTGNRGRKEKETFGNRSKVGHCVIGGACFTSAGGAAVLKATVEQVVMLVSKW